MIEKQPYVQVYIRLLALSEKTIGEGGDAASGGLVMVDASLILDAIVAVSIAAGALFTIYQLQIMARDRQTEFIMRVNEFVCSEEFQKPLCKLWETQAKDSEALEKEVSYMGLSMIADYFDGLTDLVERGLLKEDLIRGQYNYTALWDKIKPWVLPIRAKYPYIYTGFEEMAKRQA